MSRDILSPRAEADLEDTWGFMGEDMGGEKQAEHYIRMLVDAIERVSEDPRRGRPCSQARKG